MLLDPSVIGHPLEPLVRAHEQVHARQFRAGMEGSPPADPAALEREARAGAESLLSGRPFEPRLAASPDRTLAFEGDPQSEAPADPQQNELVVETIPDDALIEPSASDLLLLATASDAVILPAKQSGVYFNPRASTPAPKVASEPLVSVPTIGHGGFRAVNLGTGTAFALDAGIPTALYPQAVSQVQRALGVDSFSGLLVLHIHDDHVRRVRDFVMSHGIAPSNVHYPEAFESHPNAPSSTLARQIAGLRQAIGPGTTFSSIPTPKSGAYFHNQIREGNVRFDYYGLTAAFQQLAQDRSRGQESRVADRASLLVRATHLPTGTSILFLGDLRGADLTAFREAMGPSLFEQLLRGVTTVSGTQHHLGALRSQADRTGLVAFFNQIHELNGRLTLIVQSTEKRSGRQFLNRSLIEAIRRGGVVDVHVVKEPGPQGGGTATLGTGGAVRVQGQGVESFTHETSMDLHQRRLARLREAEQIASRYSQFLVDGQNRLEQLKKARNTLETNLQEYRRLLIEGVHTTAAGRATPTLTNQTAVNDALKKLEAEAPIEDVLRLDGMRVLRQLAAIGPDLEILRTELRRARRGNGTLSTKGIDALWNVDRGLAEKILQGSSLSRKEQRRVMQQLPGAPMRVRTRAGGLLMLGITLANDIAPLVAHYRRSAQEEDVGVAMADIQFWQGCGMRVLVDGVHDVIGTNNERTTSIQKVNELVRAKDLDYLAMTDVIKGGNALFGPWQVFEIWCQEHVLNLADWRALIASNPALMSVGSFIDDQQWFYRRGRIDEGTFGFDVVTWYEPDPELSGVLNKVAARMVRATKADIAGIESGPGPHRGKMFIGPMGYRSEPIYAHAPQAVGLRRFDPEQDEPELYTLANQASRDVPADLLLYAFPPDFEPPGSDPRPEGYVAVGGADYRSYAVLTGGRYNLVREYGTNQYGHDISWLARSASPFFYARESDLVAASRP